MHESWNPSRPLKQLVRLEGNMNIAVHSLEENYPNLLDKCLWLYSGQISLYVVSSMSILSPWSSKYRIWFCFYKYIGSLLWKEEFTIFPLKQEYVLEYWHKYNPRRGPWEEEWGEMHQEGGSFKSYLTWPSCYSNDNSI